MTPQRKKQFADQQKNAYTSNAGTGAVHVNVLAAMGLWKGSTPQTRRANNRDTMSYVQRITKSELMEYSDS